MKRIALGVCLLAVAVAGTALAFPAILRGLVIAQVQAFTGRAVRLDAATLSLSEGRLALRGLHLTELDRRTPFADVEALDVSLNARALLRGHLWIREVVVRNSMVRVIRRSSGEFNLSDLARALAVDPALDVTVDRFTVAGGTVSLEDRALPGGRTWMSEHIAIEARRLSTLHAEGTATATSVTGGAPVSIEVKRLRLHPIDLAATIAVEGADLALARVYMPADAPVVLERGRVSTSVDVTLHATGGLRVDATARFRDVAFTRPGESQPVALAPDATLRLVDVGVHDAGVRLGRLELATSLALFDPRVTPAARFELPGLRVSAADVTWPLAAPARIDVRTGVPGGGHLVAGGTVQAAPAPSDIRLRLSRLDLGPWARYLPPSARITGIAEADLRVNEPLGADIPARIRGSIAVRDLGVANQRQRLVGARRIEATGLEVQWPRRVVVRRVLIDQPSATVERDRAGQLSLPALADGAPSGSAAAPTRPPIAVEVGEIAIRNGAIAWRDQAVKPPAQLDLTRINATVRGASWPPRDPLGIQIALQPPGGGELSVAGRVGVADPPTADVRVVLKGGALAPYQRYVPTPARISGRADLDVALKVPGATEGSVGIRGQAALTQLDVRDQERTVLRVERATATGLDAQWPRRVSIGDLALQQPWILLERDERAALPLRALLEPPSGRPRPDGAAPASANGHPADPPPAVAVQRLTIEGGGARVVDRSIAPPFAIDLHRLAARMEGFSTTTGPPARLELTGRAGPDAAIALRGTVGPLGGPLRLDLDGEVREFAIPRTNPYLLRQVAWKAREGRLMTTFRGRVRGDAVEARSDIRLRHLELERAGPNDQAQARIGLPLGLIASLMKNRRGEINVSFPVSGRLDDPRFDFSEAIWRSARTVAINAIATPVSWIGRLQYTADARIEKVQIDPIPFQPGTATITPDGESQIMRLAGFLEQVPEVRLALTPVVAPRDLAALERQPPSAGDISALAEKRLEAVRDRFKQAKADRARLVENKGPARRDAADGGVQVDLVEQEGPRPPTLGERLRRLGAGILGERPSP